MERRKRKLLAVQIGTELNLGPAEDSDSVVVKKAVQVKVMGELNNGALPVKIIGEEGVTYYYHQPEKR